VAKGRAQVGRRGLDLDEEPGLPVAHDEKVQVKTLEIETERKVGKAKLNLLRLSASEA